MCYQWPRRCDHADDLDCLFAELAEPAASSATGPALVEQPDREPTAADEAGWDAREEWIAGG